MQFLNILINKIQNNSNYQISYGMLYMLLLVFEYTF